MIIDSEESRQAKAAEFKPQVKRRKPHPVNGKEENKANREKT